MNKILISQFYLIIFLSFPVLANYPLIEPIDYNLPACEFKNNKIVTKTKCLGELKNYLGYENTNFFGEIENGIPNGNGYLLAEIFEYWGGFVEGRVEGYGTMSIPQDDYTYYGDFKNNRRTGFGVDLDKANGKYIGEYKNDQREGFGKYIVMEESAIYDEKWEQNAMVDSKIDYSGFREFDSGIGIKFNHAGHLSFISKSMLEEQIPNLPDFYQGLSKRPHIERIAFWESNVFNLINEGRGFDRLIIEYDFIDDEEGEMLLSDERFYQGLYQDKYRFIIVDFSEYYENTVANNTIIKVNDRYYTIGYTAPYTNESELLNAKIKFMYFFNSWEFDVPDNEK